MPFEIRSYLIHPAWNAVKLCLCLVVHAYRCGLYFRVFSHTRPTRPFNIQIQIMFTLLKRNRSIDSLSTAFTLRSLVHAPTAICKSRRLPSYPNWIPTGCNLSHFTSRERTLPRWSRLLLNLYQRLVFTSFISQYLKNSQWPSLTCLSDSGDPPSSMWSTEAPKRIRYAPATAFFITAKA